MTSNYLCFEPATGSVSKYHHPMPLKPYSGFLSHFPAFKALPRHLSNLEYLWGYPTSYPVSIGHVIQSNSKNPGLHPFLVLLLFIGAKNKENVQKKISRRETKLTVGQMCLDCKNVNIWLWKLYILTVRSLCIAHNHSVDPFFNVHFTCMCACATTSNWPGF